MTNHLHLVCRCKTPHLLSNTLRDFKRHTSISLSRLIQQIPESRREWMMELFHREAIRINRARNFKIWKDDNHAIWLGDIDIWEKIHYVHENPVIAEIVDHAEEYIFSSARDYCGRRGLVNITKVDDD